MARSGDRRSRAALPTWVSVVVVVVLRLLSPHPCNYDPKSLDMSEKKRCGGAGATTSCSASKKPRASTDASYAESLRSKLCPDASILATLRSLASACSKSKPAGLSPSAGVSPSRCPLQPGLPFRTSIALRSSKRESTRPFANVTIARRATITAHVLSLVHADQA